MRNNPHLYELNLASWLSELSGRERRKITLGKVRVEEVTRLKKMGMDILWLMGVWERSPYSAKRARKVESILEECKNILPNFDVRQIGGSPYAVRTYVPEPRFGSFHELARFRDELNERGMSLVLDFVPNHTACDHPWVEVSPHLFISVPEGREGTCENGFFPTRHGGDRLCVAHGRDPYFPPWTDTAQLNYMEPRTHESMIRVLSAISPYCDGLRCDMAMLVLRSVFRETWKGYVNDEGPNGREFWPGAIDSVRKENPNFRFIAEVYWGLGKDLLSTGFDYAYDKDFYDLLVIGNVEGMKRHLSEPLADQERMVRFLENHDEQRAMKVFGPTRIRSAMVIHSTVPGMKMWHHGQFEGKKIRAPVQLLDGPQEEPDAEIRSFSERLLAQIDHPVFHEGAWEICAIDGWLDNATHENLLAWSWRLGAERRLIVINFTAIPSQGRIRPSARWTCDLGPVRLYDPLSGASYDRWGSQIEKKGLYVALDGYRFHFFNVENR